MFDFVQNCCNFRQTSQVYQLAPNMDSDTEEFHIQPPRQSLRTKVTQGVRGMVKSKGFKVSSLSFCIALPLLLGVSYLQPSMVDIIDQSSCPKCFGSDKCNDIMTAVSQGKGWMGQRTMAFGNRIANLFTEQLDYDAPFKGMDFVVKKYAPREAFEAIEGIPMPMDEYELRLMVNNSLKSENSHFQLCPGNITLNQTNLLFKNLLRRYKNKSIPIAHIWTMIQVNPTPLMSQVNIILLFSLSFIFCYYLTSRIFYLCCVKLIFTSRWYRSAL